MKPSCLRLGIALLWVMSSVPWARAASVELPLEPDPADPGKAKIGVGVEYSGIFDRQLGSSGSGGRNIKSGQITKANEIHARIVWALNQYLNLYAKAGETDWNEKLLFNDSVKTSINFKFAPSWGVGATGGYKFLKGWQVFYDLQYLSTMNANISSVEETGRAVTSKSGKADLNEFHIAGGVGYEFHTYYDWASVIFPYVGIRYSTLTVKHSSVTWNAGGGVSYNLGDDVDQDSSFGVMSGIRFGNESNLSLRLEGRFLDETAFTVAVDYRF